MMYGGQNKRTAASQMSAATARPRNKKRKRASHPFQPVRWRAVTGAGESGIINNKGKPQPMREASEGDRAVSNCFKKF
jgi:hypothetical protein